MLGSTTGGGGGGGGSSQSNTSFSSASKISESEKDILPWEEPFLRSEVRVVD
jgi:hypothetical protein